MLAAGSACKGDSEDPASDRDIVTTDEPGDSTDGAPAPTPSPRETTAPWRALLGESSRAELRVDGVLIDFGTADQHKYTRGGWRTGWGPTVATDDGTTASDARYYRATLDVMLDEPAAELVMRARSPRGNQRVRVRDGRTEIGEAHFDKEWEVVRVAFDEPLAAGRHTLQLEFSKRSSRKWAQLDWLWLPNTAGAAPPAPVPRVLPIDIGGEARRALVAPTSRAYRFFLEVPPAASLVFDYGSDNATAFIVRAAVDGEAPHELFRETGAPTWTEKSIDLSAYADKTVWIELATEGGEGAAAWGEPEIRVAGEPKPIAGGGSAPEPAKSAIVILIDTTRVDSFAALGEGTPATPAYDAFVDEATLFTRAYNNENWTKPSVATLLTGMYPSTHQGKTEEAELSSDIDLLSEQARGAGLSTAGFVANGYVSRFFGFRYGWDRFRNYIQENRDSKAEKVYADALRWLTKHKDERFFLYIQTIDPHVTYRVGETYWRPYFEGDYEGSLGKEIDSDEQVLLSRRSAERNAKKRDDAYVRALYWGELAYHDEHMGKFLDAVKEMGVADTTLVAITNDHGEELGDHGRYGHGHNLDEYMIRAPLAIRYPPAFPAGTRVDEIVEHVDFAPTVLDALGIEPLPDADGISLLPLIRGAPDRRPYYAVIEMLGGTRAVRVGDWKLERTRDRMRLYNVAGDDPDKTLLTKTHPIALRACEVYLGEGLGMPVKRKRLADITARRTFDAAQAEITPETRQALEALGYLGGTSQ